MPGTSAIGSHIKNKKEQKHNSRICDCKKVCHPIVGMIKECEIKHTYQDRMITVKDNCKKGSLDDKGGRETTYCEKHDWYYYKGQTCDKCKDDEGMKYDDDKLMWDLLPFDAVEKIVEIMTYGAKKYAPNNWQKVKANRYYAALFRHLVAELKGEDYDQESSYLHLAHAACNILFLLWKKINEVK